MNIRELAEALRVAGVDPSRYWLHNEPAKEVADGWLDLDPGGGRWEVEGGDDVVFGIRTTLRSFPSEDEACETFYREMTRTDGKPFAAEKAEWSVKTEREWREADEELARTNPAVAEQRAYWCNEWGRRVAAGLPAMTAIELDQALTMAGRRRDWLIGGVDEPPSGSSTGMRLISPDSDGTWYVGFVGERANFGKTLVGLSEAEASRFAYEVATKPEGAKWRLTESQWHASRENVRRYNANHGSGPLPPWPPVRR